MNISLNMALTMARPPSQNSPIQIPRSCTDRADSASSNNFSLYKGISDRSIGWKQRRSIRHPGLGSTARDMSVRRWDGAARRSTEWDCLRKDPELWDPQGNCLVHLYGQGQSRRGPAFRVPMQGLIATQCRPLLDRFLVQTLEETPSSDGSFKDSYFEQTSTKIYELYVPPPADADRKEAFLYHMATRNFFAWIFGKSLVGNHLGAALVGLLNSMSQFRSVGEDNVEAIMDYMDEEGYADMRGQPDHALAILFFAEHFRFRDLWIDAFAHCTGMNEKLINSPGFEFMSRTSRALVTRSRFEMDMRLDNCGRKLGSFLSDDLSEAHLGLSPAARAHLDRFRTFLQSYYVAKLGYYPPASGEARSASFPKNIYGQMCQEFQKLYDYLVDSKFTSSDILPISHQGGICVQQTLDSFNQRHKYSPLLHPLPLLPEVKAEDATQRPSLNKRFSSVLKADKMKPDPRLVAFSSMCKATNRMDQSLFDCTLVRAYRGFEKECSFSNSKVDKNDRLSQSDARKVRWILIYATLQTLLSATVPPEQVRDVQNIPYNICVLTAGCPPWKEERPLQTLLRTQTDQTKLDVKALLEADAGTNPEKSPNEIKPDIDYRALTQKSQHKRDSSYASLASISSSKSTKSTVRRALSTLGNMPELVHPRPQRASYHEILVHGYGNGTNTVSITATPMVTEGEQDTPRKLSSESGSSSTEDLSSRWSNASGDANDVDSPTTSISGSRRGSDSGSVESKKSIKEFLDRPMSSLGLARVPSSVYSASVYDDSILPPDPLQLKKTVEDQFMKVTTEVKVEWEEDRNGKANDELLAYLEA
ncbi:hypothetical protein N431DRAFT_553574 [Stipitochalara longipes BDJ]|nr:hypothetical protein N431DRAFT_553574 [Stipitochalara longipes BDJ]